MPTIRTLTYVCAVCGTRTPQRQTVSSPDGTRRLGPWRGSEECKATLLACMTGREPDDRDLCVNCDAPAVVTNPYPLCRACYRAETGRDPYATR